MNNWDKHWLNEKRKLWNPVKRQNYLNYRIVAELREHINLFGIDAIELGCGTGRLSNFLSKYTNTVTLVDSSEPALEIARELLTGKNAVFLNNDLLKMKAASKYDLVISSGLVEHFKSDEFSRLIKLHADLAKKNGYCCFIFPSNNPHQRKSVRTKDSIEKYGWQNPLLEDAFLLPKNLSIIVKKRIDFFSRVLYFFMVIHRVLFHFFRIDLNTRRLENKYGGYVFILAKKV